MNDRNTGPPNEGGGPDTAGTATNTTAAKPADNPDDTHPAPTTPAAADAIPTARQPNPWLQRLSEWGFGPAPLPPRPPAILRAGEIDARERAFARAVQDSEAANLATTATGRNDRLNRAAYTLSAFVNTGALTREEVEDALTDAGRACSSLGDHPFTDSEIAATIRSGLDSGLTKGLARYAPDDAGVVEVAPGTLGSTAPPKVPVVPRSTAERAAARKSAHSVFRKWLGADYDFDAVDAVLAAAAVGQLGGDPLWLLLVSGSGNAKTETVQSLSRRVHTHIVSTISSPGALLSATSKRDRTSDATGGLLRLIGSHGVLVIKDVTSIVSMGREMRAEVLAALREIYDGRWVRTVGTDGGKTLAWEGRIVVIGAVTTAWDSTHAVVASMGDRFVLLRMDSTTGRQAAGRKAISNTGNETTMRTELAAAVADVLDGAATEPVTLDESDSDRLLAAADLVTLARTAVEFDSRGDVADAHAPEMPTRFAKQLAQVVRGGMAVGMTRDEAMRLAIRCARDSMPPLRLAIIDHLATHPRCSTSEVRKGIDKPRTTVDRQLQALHMLGVLECDEGATKDARILWSYSLREDIDPGVLAVPPKTETSPEMSVSAYALGTEVAEAVPFGTPSDKSGDFSLGGAR